MSVMTSTDALDSMCMIELQGLLSKICAPSEYKVSATSQHASHVRVASLKPDKTRLMAGRISTVECCICYRVDPEEIGLLDNCDHLFCYSCISQWRGDKARFLDFSVAPMLDKRMTVESLIASLRSERFEAGTRHTQTGIFRGIQHVEMPVAHDNWTADIQNRKRLSCPMCRAFSAKLCHSSLEHYSATVVDLQMVRNQYFDKLKSMPCPEFHGGTRFDWVPSCPRLNWCIYSHIVENRGSASGPFQYSRPPTEQERTLRRLQEKFERRHLTVAYALNTFLSTHALHRRIWELWEVMVLWKARRDPVRTLRRAVKNTFCTLPGLAKAFQQSWPGEEKAGAAIHLLQSISEAFPASSEEIFFDSPDELSTLLSQGELIQLARFVPERSVLTAVQVDEDFEVVCYIYGQPGTSLDESFRADVVLMIACLATLDKSLSAVSRSAELIPLLNYWRDNVCSDKFRLRSESVLDGLDFPVRAEPWATLLSGSVLSAKTASSQPTFDASRMIDEVTPDETNLADNWDGESNMSYTLGSDVSDMGSESPARSTDEGITDMDLVDLIFEDSYDNTPDELEPPARALAQPWQNFLQGDVNDSDGSDDEDFVAEEDWSDSIEFESEADDDDMSDASMSEEEIIRQLEA